jgi:hypothetical protein
MNKKFTEKELKEFGKECYLNGENSSENLKENTDLKGGNEYGK